MPRFAMPATSLLLGSMLAVPCAFAQSAAPCAAERARLAAEATTPGIVQRLMQEALAVCEQQAATAPRPAAAPSAGAVAAGQAPASR